MRKKKGRGSTYFKNPSILQERRPCFAVPRVSQSGITAGQILMWDSGVL
jgi:hypothetical protein